MATKPAKIHVGYCGSRKGDEYTEKTYLLPKLPDKTIKKDEEALEGMYLPDPMLTPPDKDEQLPAKTPC